MEYRSGKMKKRRHNSMIISLLILIIVIILLIVVLLWKNQIEYKANNEENKKQETVIKKNTSTKKEPDNPEKNAKIEGIVCWGDSLTYGLAGGYPKVLEELLKKDRITIPVANEGVTSEDTQEIMERAGAFPSYLAKDITIPADKKPVMINLVNDEGDDFNQLLANGSSSCIVSIEGIQGKVLRKSSAGKSSYEFTRLTKGASVLIKSKTKLTYDFVNRYENYIPVIFMGTNGGWSSAKELIQQQQMILDVFPENKQFIIIGLTYQHYVEDKELDEAMEEHWGEHYLNLREYLSGQGIYDAGLKPSSSDLEQMKQGIVPDIIRTDKVHYKEVGYQVLGKFLYQRMQELGYLK